MNVLVVLSITTYINLAQSNICISGSGGVIGSRINGVWEEHSNKINGKRYYVKNNYHLYYDSALKIWTIGDNLICSNGPCQSSTYYTLCTEQTDDVTKCSGKVYVVIDEGKYLDDNIIIKTCSNSATTPELPDESGTAPDFPESANDHGTARDLAELPDERGTAPDFPELADDRATAPDFDCSEHVVIDGRAGSHLFVNGDWIGLAANIINEKQYYTKQYNGQIYYLLYVSGCHAFNQWIIDDSLENGDDDNICSRCSEGGQDCVPKKTYYAQCPQNVELNDCNGRWQFKIKNEWINDKIVKSVFTSAEC